MSGSRDETVKVWNASSGECVNTLEGHSGWVTSVAIGTEGGEEVIFFSGSYDKTVKVWNASTGEFVQSMTDRLAERRHISYYMLQTEAPDYHIISSGNKCQSTLYKALAVGNIMYIYKRCLAPGKTNI